MTSRVVIRPLTMDDCDAFLAAVARSRALHRPWVTPPSTRAAFRGYVERHATETQRGFLIIEGTSGQLAGVINIGQIIRGPLQSAFLGYYTFAGFEQRGFMRDGLQQVLHHAFTKLKLHRLEANIQPGNITSKRLVRGLGFTREGFSRRYLKVSRRWRDHERWALLVEDWKRPKRPADKSRSAL